VLAHDLYVLLWNNINNTYAPVTGGRGADAESDWTANKPLKLTRQLGRALTIAGAGAGLTDHPLGAFDGAETVTLSASNLTYHVHAGPWHAHGPSSYPYFINSDGSVQTFDYAGIGTPVAAYSTSGVTNATAGAGNGDTSAAGGSAPFGVQNPRSFWNIMIKL